MITVSSLISAAVQCIIGWLFIDRIPAWLKIRGIVATILRILGVIIIIAALLSLF